MQDVPLLPRRAPNDRLHLDLWAQRRGCRAKRGARRNLIKAFRAERREATATVIMRQSFRKRDRVRYSPANVLKGRVIHANIRLALDISPWAPRLTSAITEFFAQPVRALR
jgi:hypothetical protein